MSILLPMAFAAILAYGLLRGAGPLLRFARTPLHLLVAIAVALVAVGASVALVLLVAQATA